MDETNKIVLNSKTGEIRYSNEMSSYYGRGLYYGDKKIEKNLWINTVIKIVQLLIAKFLKSKKIS